MPKMKGQPNTNHGLNQSNGSDRELPEVVLARRALPYMDPVLMFHRVCNGPNNLLLESAEIDSKRHLQSFLMTKSAVRIVCRGRVVTARALSVAGQQILDSLGQTFQERKVAGLEVVQSDSAGGRQITFRFSEGDRQLDEDSRLVAPSVFEPLRRIRECVRLQAGDEAGLFVGGLFAYDLVEQFEPLPAATDGDGCPDYVFHVAEQVVHFDHVHQAATATQLGLGAESMPGLERELNELVLRIEAAGETELPPVAEVTGEPVVDLRDERFREIVGRLKEEVVRGVVFQCVPSRSFRYPCPAPLRAYRRLRATNPSPYMFYVNDEEFVLFGASPETAVKFTVSDRMVELCPIAGTRPRGFGTDGRIDLDLDGRIELELRTDQKEMSEHLMLVDLARNDLARICDPGTRHVAQLLRVDRYSHVMHLVSRVKGRLRSELDGLHAYQACMNMGTLTGAPKVQAMQLIRELEGQRRGSYGGAVGYFNGSGDLDSCIVIRSAFVRNGVARVQAGAGVVHDSDPQSEANETRGKAQAVINALRNSHLDLDENSSKGGAR